MILGNLHLVVLTMHRNDPSHLSVVHGYHILSSNRRIYPLVKGLASCRVREEEQHLKQHQHSVFPAHPRHQQGSIARYWRAQKNHTSPDLLCGIVGLAAGLAPGGSTHPQLEQPPTPQCTILNVGSADTKKVWI